MSTDTPWASSGASSKVQLSAWRDLFTQTRRQADDQRDLEDQLKAWSEKNCSAGAAIYRQSAAGGGSFERWICVGTTNFPQQFDALDVEDGRPKQPELAQWRCLELPGLALLHDARVEDESAVLLLLAGAKISQLKRQIQEQSFEAMFRGVELEALYEVGLAIASTLDLKKLGEEVLLRAALLLDARRAALYLIEDGTYRLTSRLGGSAMTEFSDGQLDLESLVAGEGALPEDLLPGARYLLAVWVEIEGSPKGLLVVGDKESRVGVGPFAAKDRRTLSLFANQAAIALENAKLHMLALEKERLEREMELAAEIQQQILPKSMPEIPGFDVIGWNRPAQQVGGDYFDFQKVGDGRWVLVVGDVTGKGMPAALLVSTVHSALRVLLDRMEIGPALIERLNRHIYESSSTNKFITMLLAFLDTDSGDLAYVNAGHNPGVLIRRDGEVAHLSSKGLPLGLLPESVYGSADLRLEPGDLVCIYSDGITECESSKDEEEFGLGRLIELLARAPDRCLQEILQEIDETMLTWAQGRAQGDDQTVILLRRR